MNKKEKVSVDKRNCSPQIHSCQNHLPVLEEDKVRLTDRGKCESFLLLKCEGEKGNIFKKLSCEISVKCEIL